MVLNLLKFEFDILCFSESKIVEGTLPKSSIILEGYHEPVGMPTKATKGGVLMYIKNGISFAPREDLIIRKAKIWNPILFNYITLITTLPWTKTSLSSNT